MASRRVARIVYVICGVGGVVLVLAIASFVAFAPAGLGDAFVSGLTWPYSPERAALKGAGCIHSVRVPRPRKESMRANGSTDEAIARYCESDGRCGYEAVQCTALEQNVVPCSILASLHKQYAKPDRRYIVKTTTLPKMKLVCEAVYGPDGTLLVDMVEWRKSKKSSDSD